MPCIFYVSSIMLCPNLQQVAKGAKDSMTEVIRSGDLIAYTAEEGVRWLGEVKL